MDAGKIKTEMSRFEDEVKNFINNDDVKNSASSLMRDIIVVVRQS
jgi:hypothetical protein